MSQLNLPAFRDENFEASAALNGGTLTLHFKGSAELQVSEVLGPLLMQAHQEALRLGTSEVQVDFEQLHFMTSSCLKRFVTWLSEVQGSPRKPYSIRFISNSRFRWQKASLAALQCFAPEVITVEQLPPLPAGNVA